MLGTLPPELFSQIASLLALPDLASLRLTSRRTERQSTKSFGSAAFSTLPLSFGVDNLQWVGNIASHDAFRLAVRCVRIGKWDTGKRETGIKSSYEMGYGIGGSWPRREDGRLDRQSELVQKFINCLSLFTNCVSIIVTDERILDPHSPQYRGPDRHLSSADAVDLVFYALSTARLPSLRCLYTCIRHGLDWYPPGSITRSAVASVDKSVTDNLEELTLELRAEDPGSTASLLQLVTAAPRLTKLRLFLDLNATTTDEHTGSVVSHQVDNLLHSPPRLHTLLLARLKISETALLRLLSGSSDTMRRVDFDGVTLRPGSWTAVLEHLRTAPFRRLRRLSMHLCREGPSEPVVAFCSLWKSGEAYKFGDLSFSFRLAVTARLPVPAYHLAGALFRSSGDGSGTERALRAMVEHSHLCPRDEDPGPRCAKPHELMGAEDGRRSDGLTTFEFWTGLPAY